jgi:adenylate cyclase
MRHLGYAPWPKSPRFCQACHKTMAKAASGGAEVEISVMFADLRGSTAIAETISPSEFGALISRFYAAADAAITDSDGVVDNHIGDGVLGLFIPVWAGHDHAATAIGAARALLAATGNDGPSPWAPVGIGINTGVAFVGVVALAEGPDDFTALGDVVNTASRLSSAAAAGEILISLATADEAHIQFRADQRRSLDLKGKQDAFEAVAIGFR